MSAPVTSASSTAEKFERARALAALIGMFDPRRLVPLEPDPAAGREALGRLARECTEVESGNRIFWRLTPDSRRATLDQLRRNGTLEQFAAAADELAIDDFGKYLVATLFGRVVALKGLSKEQLGALHTALQFAGPVLKNAMPPDLVDTHLARREIDDALGMAVPTRLIGRNAALRVLRDFVAAPLSAAALRGDQPPIPLAVSGIGGAGKSALIAEFARRHRRADWRGVPVVWLDFDRAALAAADAVTLLLEFSRQLALYRPALSGRLAAFRRDMRARANGRGDLDSYEHAASLASEAWSAWSMHLDDALPITEQVVLVLDTFEEILLREAGERRHVERWVTALYAEGRIYGLRPIFSGRSVEAGLDSGSVPEHHVLQLGELEPRAAVAVLSDQLRQLQSDPASFPLKQLVEKFGRNPLLLKLMGRFLAEQGPDEASTLLADDRNAFRSHFAQRFLYARILRRIRSDDPDVEKLAYPGLVLRRVTPDLIEKVLAQPCGLGHVDAARAEDLFSKLSRQIWLVEQREGDAAVWHRRDLRRLMTQAMAGADNDVAAQIHALAAQYYARCLDPGLGRADQEVEARYHSMFTTQPDMPARGDTSYFVMRIGEDIENIPLPWRAHLKFAANRTLKPDEALHLDAGDRRAYESRRLRLKARRGEFAGSDDSAMAEPGVISVQGFFSPAPEAEQFAGDSIELGVELAFASADLPSILSMRENVVTSFFTHLAGGAREDAPPRRDFVESAIWRTALAGTVLPGPSPMQHLIEQQIEAFRHRIEWVRPVLSSDSHSITVATAVHMLLALLGGRLSIDMPFPYHDPTKTIDTVDDLRAFQLLGQTGMQEKIPVRTGLLRYLSPPFFTLIGNRGGEVVAALALRKQAVALFGRLQTERVPSLAEVQRLQSGHVMLTTPSETPQPGLEALFPGAVPELYPLVRGALRTAGPATLVGFAETARHLSVVWPRELQPDQLGMSLERDRQRWLATLIDISDRCGLLARLLEYCRDREPVGTVLEHTIRLCNAYEKALCGTLPLPNPTGEIPWH